MPGGLDCWITSKSEGLFVECPARAGIFQYALLEALEEYIEVSGNTTCSQCGERFNLPSRLPDGAQYSPTSVALEYKRRVRMLEEVFLAFDIEGTGKALVSELTELGLARGTLKQTDQLWNATRNDKCISAMGAAADGKVSIEEFVKGFENAIEGTNQDVDTRMEEFLLMAAYVRKQRFGSPKQVAGFVRKLRDEHEPSPQKQRPLSEEEYQRRMLLLVEVFDAFDIKNEGLVDKRDLFELATSRAELKMDEQEWSITRNENMVNSIVLGEDGLVHKKEFLMAFECAIQGSEQVVNKRMQEFQQIADYIFEVNF